MPLGRREFLRLAGLVAAGAATGACSPLYRRVGEALAEPLVWVDGDLATFRVLSRLTYGPTLAERAEAASMGAAAWIEEQLQPDGIPDHRANLLVRPLTSLTLEAADLAAWDREDVIQELRSATLLRRVHSRRQLFERLVEFWTDHFNISVDKGDCWYLKPVDDRQVIRRHALGNLRDLLLASAHSPAMLVYLDNQANDRSAPNENYARELLELHTLGVDGGYGQADVMELARCLTGWTVRARFWRGEFDFREEMHDPGSKVVLGIHLEPSGVAEAEAVIERLASHPETARRTARKLVRRFLVLDPPDEAALAEKAAAALLGSRGEILPMLRVILLDGVAAETELRPKYKRPMDMVGSALRMVGASTDGGVRLHEHLNAMGQPLFAWPTPDGPPEDPASWQSGLFARWKFAHDLARGEIPGTELDLRAVLDAAGAVDPLGAAGALSQLLLGGRLAGASLEGMARVVEPAWDDDGPAVLLAGLLAAPGFQWT